MLIECTLKRDQPIEVAMQSEVYVFAPDSRGRRVCEVHVETHIECFLAVPHLYREVRDDVDETEAREAPDPQGFSPISAIKGIGSKLVTILAGLDPPVTTLEQIAAWSADDVARVEKQIKSFPGRIEREKWVEQAKAIIAARAEPFYQEADDEMKAVMIATALEKVLHPAKPRVESQPERFA